MRLVNIRFFCMNHLNLSGATRTRGDPLCQDVPETASLENNVKSSRTQDVGGSGQSIRRGIYGKGTGAQNEASSDHCSSAKGCTRSCCLSGVTNTGNQPMLRRGTIGVPEGRRARLGAENEQLRKIDRLSGARPPSTQNHYLYAKKARRH